jgi:hypothetical protein
MVSLPFTSWLAQPPLRQWQSILTVLDANPLSQHPSLSELARWPESRLPRFVRESAIAMKYLHLLGPMDWAHFPERPDQRFDPNCAPLPYATLVASYLVQLDQHLLYVADLHQYLRDHPPLVWILGFPLVPSTAFSWGFDVSASLPTHRHLSRLLRTAPNATGQYLLDESVRLIRAELPDSATPFGDCISLDTKHIIAWVKENNPKAYIKGRRYDKHQQPAGDPDCRLGCKRKSNQSRAAKPHLDALPSTPTTNPVPARGVAHGEYYWGYGSGVVATKVADWGEFVLAELTQPFDQLDVSYFKPLLTETARRLEAPPRFGAFDAAFDAFYVYEYFDDAHGFAAVPIADRGGHAKRSFSLDGLPLCAAHLPMPLRYRFRSRTSLVEHECGRYVCPLYYPERTRQRCPAHHENWKRGGCITTMATSKGARIRYQLDRESPAYQEGSLVLSGVRVRTRPEPVAESGQSWYTQTHAA